MCGALIAAVLVIWILYTGKDESYGRVWRAWDFLLGGVALSGVGADSGISSATAAADEAEEDSI